MRALSGGQRRRLDVALGIVGNPELLFLDEADHRLRPRGSPAFWDLVRDLRGDGTTDPADHPLPRRGARRSPTGSG